MIAVLDAVKSHLEAALSMPGLPVAGFIADAGAARAPYFLVWSGAGDRSDDEAVGGPCGDFGGPLGVTCTAASPTAALNMAAAVIQALAPGREPKSLPGVAGRHVVLSFVDARPVQVDRSLTLTSTKTHPAYAVVMFDVHSQPL